MRMSELFGIRGLKLACNRSHSSRRNPCKGRTPSLTRRVGKRLASRVFWSMAYASSDASNRSTGIRSRCAPRQGCSLSTNMQYRRSSLTSKERARFGTQTLRPKLQMTETSRNRLLSLASGAFQPPSTAGRHTPLHWRRLLYAIA
jgi:hypothetical protein